MHGMRLADVASRAVPVPIAPMPIRPLSVLTALLHVYIALRLVPALAMLTPAWPLALVALAVSAFTIPLPFISRRSERNASLKDALKWTGLISMGWFSSMFVLTLVRDTGLLLTWLAGALAGLQVSWNAVLPWSAMAVLVVATLASFVGFLNARRTAAVKRVEVPIQGLPSALEGFTIAQLSDIHVGPTIRSDYIQRIVDAVNRLGADAIAITGDLVDGTVAELRDHIAPLA